MFFKLQVEYLADSFKLSLNVNKVKTPLKLYLYKLESHD